MSYGLRFAIALCACAFAAPAPAAVFPVNSLADGTDVAPGNGICDADPSAAVVCTLRAAVQEANALPGTDEIQLGAGTHALTLAGIEESGAAGDLDVFSEVRIEGLGTGVTVIDQTTSDRVFEISFVGGTLELADLTVAGGDCADNPSNLGGGIRNASTLHLERVELTGNRAQIGGGVFNFEVMTAVDVTIAGNTTTSRGAGIASASFSASGGPGTTLVLTNSTIGPNTSVGVPSEMELANAESAVLTNVTVSPTPAGVHAVTIGNQNVQLVHVTLLGGLATFSFDGSHELTFTNSAVEYCIAPGSPMVVFREGVNASTDAGCGFAAAGGIEGPFGLGALADNGGPTPTHLPADPGSALVDAADDAFCVASDQRGATRPRGAHCDIGAVEAPEAHSVGAGFAALFALSLRARRTRS